MIETRIERKMVITSDGGDEIDHDEVSGGISVETLAKVIEIRWKEWLVQGYTS